MVIDICNYWTYKKKENPTVYYVRDGVKGWCKDTVNPTLFHDGWKLCAQNFDYNLFHDEKPKHMAIRLLEETHGKEWMNGKKFIYYPYYYTGGNGYMDAIYVYFKEKEDEKIS